MHLSAFDEEAMLVDSESYFYLWCCLTKHTKAFQFFKNGAASYSLLLLERSIRFLKIFPTRIYVFK